jgi:hypothetical protein
MKLMRVIVPMVLVPAIIAQQGAQSWSQYPSSVRRLLNHPQEGMVGLTLRDGTHTEGKMFRVTDQAVFLSEAYRGGPGCESFDLSRIAAVRRYSDVPLFSLMAVISAPFWIHIVVKDGVSDFFKLFHGHPKSYGGLWESMNATPDGIVKRVVFGDDGYVRQYDFLRQTGRYRVEQGKLYLTFTSGREEDIPIHFGCETIDLEGYERPLQFMEWEHDLDRAYPPIAGRWSEFRGPGRQIEWYLMPDGSFHIDSVENDRLGGFKRVDDGVEVLWTNPSTSGPEQWHVLSDEANRLFITRDGETVEYKRASE